MALVFGFVIGYVLAIPPGPLGLAAIRYGSRGSLAPVAALAVGAGALDVVYCLLAMWTSGGILTLIAPVSQSGGTGSYVVGTQLVIALGMVVAGVILFRSSRRAPRASKVDDSPGWTSRIGRSKAFVPLLAGVGFAVANVANPTFLPSLVVLSGSIRSAGILDSTSADVIGFSLGFGVGNALWLVTLGMLTRRFHDRLVKRILPHVQTAMGVLLAGAGVFYIARIVSVGLS
jgi:threonine/homoserine/homoserine lactone efflux protein